MKPFSKTAIFGVVVVAICALAFWDFENTKKEEEDKAESEKALAHWNTEDIQELRIVNGDKELLLKLSDQQWRVDKPIKDQADESSVKSMISAISADTLTSLDLQGAIDWAKYGLDTGKRFIEFIGKDEKKEKIFVSSKKSYDGKWYLKYENKEGLFLGSQSWESWLSRKPNEVRNKKLFSNFEKIQALDIIEGKKKISFSKDSNNWVIDNDKKFPVKEDKVNELMSSLQNFRAVDVVAEDNSSENLRKYDLSAPFLELDLKTSENQEIKIFVSKKSKHSENDRFVYMSHRPFIYKTYSSVVEKWQVAKANFKKEPEPKEEPKPESSKLPVDLPDFSKDGHDH